MKLVYRKSLQSIILLDFWERTEQKLQSFDWEKKNKSQRQNEPENPPRKEQEISIILHIIRSRVSSGVWGELAEFSGSKNW